jgi:hypothetical protein
MKYDMDAALCVLHKAPDEYPDRMPTAGQLAAMCKAGCPAAARDTVEMLKRTHGDDYYEKDYSEGVRDGINRPVRDVLCDEVGRGWRDASELARYDAQYAGFGNGPVETVHGGQCSSPRCRALEKEWGASAQGKELSREENLSRIKILMRAFNEDQQELREKKFIDRLSQ